MVDFSFPKRSAEEEGVSDEAESEMDPQEGRGDGAAHSRRILILAGIGVLLIGGAYLASRLFLAPSPAPSPPSRTAVPTTPVPAQPPAKEAVPSPGAPPKGTGKADTKPAEPPVSGKAAPPAPAGKEATAGKTGGIPIVTPGRAAPRPEATAPKAGAKSPATAPASFSLQVGAMVMEENAEALKRKLDAGGFPATIRKGTAFVAKQVVTVGEPTSKREAEDLARQLNVDGFPSQLLAVGGKYTPQVGAFFNLDEAIDLARELQKKNYHPKLTSMSANTVVYQVRHGKFDSRTAAVNRGEELKSKGFNFLVVRE